MQKQNIKLKFRSTQIEIFKNVVKLYKRFHRLEKVHKVNLMVTHTKALQKLFVHTLETIQKHKCQCIAEFWLIFHCT